MRLMEGLRDPAWAGLTKEVLVLRANLKSQNEIYILTFDSLRALSVKLKCFHIIFDSHAEAIVLEPLPLLLPSHRAELGHRQRQRIQILNYH